MKIAQSYKDFPFIFFQKRQSYTTDVFKTGGSPRHYLAHLIHGTAKIESAKETIYLEENDYFYIPAGLPYRSHWFTHAENPIEFFSFGFDFFPADENTTYKLQKLNPNPQARMLFTKLEQDLTPSPEAISMLYQIIAELYPAMETCTQTILEYTLNKALAYMRQTDRYSIRDVADHCGISESSLYIKFRKHLGQTPIEMRHKILIERASLLLHTTDLTIEDISHLLGFSSPSYFHRVFYKNTGKTPSAFRREAQRI